MPLMSHGTHLTMSHELRIYLSHEFHIYLSHELHIYLAVRHKVSFFTPQMSHGTHQWAMSHMNEACFIWIRPVSYEWVMFSRWLLFTNSLSVRQLWVTTHWWMSHVSYCPIWVSHISCITKKHELIFCAAVRSHDTRMNASWRTYECVMAHIWMRHVTHVNESLLCNVLQHTAAHCNTLQHTAAHCNTLQHTATHCNILQHTATHCNTLNTLQHTTTHCNTLQHTTTHCNTLQHTATHCNPTSYFCTIMQ